MFFRRAGCAWVLVPESTCVISHGCTEVCMTSAPRPTVSLGEWRAHPGPCKCGPSGGEGTYCCAALFNYLVRHASVFVAVLVLLLLCSSASHRPCARAALSLTFE